MSDDVPVLVERIGGKRETRKVTKAGLRKIEELAAGGVVDTAIAQRLGMAKSTFRAVRTRQPEVEDALAAGRANLESDLVDVLVKKAQKGDTVAAIFLLKGMFAWSDKGDTPPPSVIHVSGADVKVEVAPRLSEQQFRELLDRRGPVESPR